MCCRHTQKLHSRWGGLCAYREPRGEGRTCVIAQQSVGALCSKVLAVVRQANFLVSKLEGSTGHTQKGHKESSCNARKVGRHKVISGQFQDILGQQVFGGGGGGGFPMPFVCRPFRNGPSQAMHSLQLAAHQEDKARGAEIIIYSLSRKHGSRTAKDY